MYSGVLKCVQLSVLRVIRSAQACSSVLYVCLGVAKCAQVYWRLFKCVQVCSSVFSCVYVCSSVIIF